MKRFILPFVLVLLAPLLVRAGRIETEVVSRREARQG